MSSFLISWGRVLVPDVNLVRTLCRKILDEKDPQRLEELLSDLRTAMKGETEEARDRVRYLFQKYAHVLS